MTPPNIFVIGNLQELGHMILWGAIALDLLGFVRRMFFV